jgi:hypothetical protein
VITLGESMSPWFALSRRAALHAREITVKASRPVFIAVLCILALSGMLPGLPSAAPAAAVDTAVARASAPFTEATLVAHHSGKCMDVANASQAIGATVHQWTCVTGRLNQQWTFTRQDNGYYTVQAVHSGLCLDVEVAGQENGRRVQQWTCVDGRTNQQWRLAQRPNGNFNVVARHSGKCLEVSGGSQADGAVLVQWTCDSDRPYQEWYLG